MHRVGGGGRVIDDDTDGGVATEVLDVPFFWVGGVTFIGEEEDGVVVVCAIRCSAERPEEVSGIVHVEIDIHVLGCGRIGCGDGVIGFSY